MHDSTSWRGAGTSVSRLGSWAALLMIVLISAGCGCDCAKDCPCPEVTESTTGQGGGVISFKGFFTVNPSSKTYIYQFVDIKNGYNAGTPGGMQHRVAGAFTETITQAVAAEIPAGTMSPVKAHEAEKVRVTTFKLRYAVKPAMGAPTFTTKTFTITHGTDEAQPRDCEDIFYFAKVIIQFTDAGPQLTYEFIERYPLPWVSQPWFHQNDWACPPGSPCAYWGKTPTVTVS
jgi:hypothetical protein